MSKIPLYLNHHEQLVGYVKFTDRKIKERIIKSINKNIFLELGGGVIIKSDGKGKLINLSINGL